MTPISSTDALRFRQRLEVALGFSLLFTCECGSSGNVAPPAPSSTLSSASAPDAPPDPRGVCVTPSQPSVFGDIDLRGFDWAEERLYGVSGTHGEDVGAKCKTARDPDACAAHVSMLAPTGSFPVPNENGDPTYVAFTHGDDVGAITTSDDFTRILGAIDTPARASVLLGLLNHEVACDSLRFGDDGYYFTERVDACDGTTYQLVRVYHLSSVGVLSLVDVTKQEDPTGNSGGVCGAGRFGAGVSVAPITDDGSAGAYLGRMAASEAASVVAFRDLAKELRAHGAPRALSALALRSAREEAHHARVIRRHAVRMGGHIPSVERRPTARRSLVALACENVREGCVGETFGALQLHHQSKASGDRELAADLGRIAREEASHALLSVSIDTWARSKLSRAEGALVSKAQNDALESLLTQWPDVPSPTRRALGLPTPSALEGLVRQVARTLTG